jgi:hypothetical protein
MLKRLLVVVLFLLVFLMAEGQNFAQFKEELLNTGDWNIARQKIIAYIPTTNDVEELRELQSIWESVEPDACKQYFVDTAKSNPNSPVYQYLALRLEEDETLQMKGAEELCRNYPDFYWGYRLYIVDFMAWLLNAELETPSPLSGQELALKIFDEGYKQFPDDDYFHIFQFHRYRLTQDYPRAEKELKLTKDRNLLMANWMRIKYFLVQEKNATLYSSFMPPLLSELIKSGQMASADSIFAFAEGYVEILQETENWQGIEQFFTQNPIVLNSASYFDVYAGLLARQENWYELSNELLSAFNRKVIDSEHLSQYLAKWEDNLCQQPHWQELKQKAETQSQLPSPQY